MAYQMWSQDIFTKGETSPLLAARITTAAYYNGMKTATNVITYPQGAAGKRFGTTYQNTITGITDKDEIFFKSMQYLNECLYLIVIIPGFIQIYLEGILVQTVVWAIAENEIRLIDYTILDNIFRVTTGIYAPQDITRGRNTVNVISAAGTNLLTLTTPVTAGLIIPVRFENATAGTAPNFALPVTTPQVLRGRTYFAYYTSTTEAEIYNTAPEAKARINAFTISSNGTGTNNLVPLNNWAINPTSFRFKPTYDFGDVNYDGYTFTPGAISGNDITLTSSSAVFTPEHVGGTFDGNSGIGRIISVTSTTVARMNILTGASFADTTAIPGSEAFLREPAWSTSRGWPRVCSSFQNRAFFANTDLLSNGLWGSMINDYNDFDDSEQDADNAISWYPTSDDINYIRFIVPYRSLTIHTNSGVFSTPLSVETAITPSNFSLTLQDSTPAEAVQPRGIDNQIVILSGNDAHSLLWDGFNNAYQSNIISIANEQLIRTPVDEAAYVDLTRAGSRYMLIVNEDGTLAIYQTLISEDVQGFTPAILEQSYGNAYFRWVTTSFDGRGWFVTEREIADAAAPIAISGFTTTTLTATASAFSATTPIAVQFTTSSALPVSVPQIAVSTWYWALGVDANTFTVYPTQADALAGVDSIAFSSAGTSSNVVSYPLSTKFFIEELSFESKVDCGVDYSGVAASTFTATNFNAQDVVINGDGYGFDYIGIDSQVETVAHGIDFEVTEAQYGFPINVVIEPNPISVYGQNVKGSNLVEPKHIRSVKFMFADTIGGEVNGIPISMDTFAETPFGSAPVPTNGEYEISLMAGWDDYKNIGFSITHSNPFDIKLIGIFYTVDV